MINTNRKRAEKKKVYRETWFVIAGKVKDRDEVP